MEACKPLRGRLAGTLPFRATEQDYTFVKDTKQSFLYLKRFPNDIWLCYKAVKKYLRAF